MAAACTLALVFVTVYDVGSRKLFKSGSIALQELEWYLFSALILLGAASTLLHDEHVRVDIFYSRLGQRGQAIVNCIGTVLFLLPFSAFAVYSSWTFVLDSIYPQFEHSPDPGGLSYRFVVKALIPMGFFALCLQGVGYFFSQLGIVFQKNG